MSFLGVNKESCDGIAQILELVPEQRHLLPSQVWNLQLGPGYWTSGKKTYVEDMRLLFLRSGRGWYRIDGEEFPISRNSVILLNTGTTFEHAVDHDDPPHIFASSFRLRDNATHEVVPSPAPPFYVAYNTTDANAIEPHFLMLANAFQRKEDLCQYNLQKACLHCILGRIRADLESLLRKSDPRIEKGRQTLADRPLADIDWEDLARSVGMSRDYFCRRFTKEVGVSPKSYHLKVKMEYAQFLLETSDSTVQEVADTLGYSDAFTFSRQFKRSRGISPSAVRRGGS